MNVEGSREFAAPAEKVWDVLSDPESIAGLLPGVSSFVVADDRHWSARVKVPLSMGRGKLKFSFETLEERPIEFARALEQGRGQRRGGDGQYGDLVHAHAEGRRGDGDGVGGRGARLWACRSHG